MIKFYENRYPRDTRIDIALSSTYGFGKHTATSILQSLGILPSTPLYLLKEENFIAMASKVEIHTYGISLKSKISTEAQEGYNLGIKRYVRQRKGLPSRGQRTCTNAKTAKRLNRKRFASVR
jgi:small subunit ribosomal protein S13